MKKWQTTQFKQAQSEWYQRLKEEGFEDIEVEVRGDCRLKQFSNHFLRKDRASAQGKDNREDYFRILSQRFEEEDSFDSEFDRLIMQMTIQGKSDSDISRELRALGTRKFDQKLKSQMVFWFADGREELVLRTKCNRNSIRYVRRRYEDRWGIRQWTPEQKVSRRVIKSS